MSYSKHIFLSGFMGSGKSSLGKKLASLIQVPFFDLDAYIEKKYERSISSLFDEEGEATFRKMEQLCLNELILHKTPSVISLGGGTVCFENNLLLVKNNGLLIHIALPAASLCQRLLSKQHTRPLLKNFSTEELLHFIEQKLVERNSFYRQSHLEVNGLNLTAQQLQQLIGDYQKKNTA